MEIEDKSYKSKLYYDVVIKSGLYKGFYITYVGIGTMIFTDGKEEIKVDELTSRSDKWMKECWEQFINQVDEHISFN